MNKPLMLVASVAAILVLAACSGGDSNDGNGDSATSAGAATGAGSSGTTGGGQGSGGGQRADGTAEDGQKQKEPGIEIVASSSQFGEILFDDSEQAIYLFDKEKSSTSKCYGECASAWPPVLTKGQPQAAGRAKPDLLGTTKREDGSTQATYAGHPLYYYIDDPPNEVLCHNVNEFGGNWLVVKPDGTPAA